MQARQTNTEETILWY